MPRSPRYPVVGLPYHVTQRGNNRCPTFGPPSDYAFFRECVASAARRYGCAVHAYVLMTNHVHLLVTPLVVGAIGRVMQSVGRRYVRRFNEARRRTGTLWEGRYRATVIDTERYLFACYRYIELNPVRAGLTLKPADYRWSSHGANALGWHDSLVTPHEQYLALGADSAAQRAAYESLFESDVDDSVLRRIRYATKTGWALGDERFCREIASLTSCRTRPRKRGRPATRR